MAKNEGIGALKKNKSNKRQATNQPRPRPRSAPTNNPGQQNRRNSESPGRAAKKTRGSRLKIENKPPSPFQNLPLGIHAISLARKKRQGCNNEKTNCSIWFRLCPHAIHTTQCFYNPSHDANMVVFLTPIQPDLPRLYKKTQTRKNSTLITETRTKIHPNPKPNELMESAQEIII